MNAGLDLRELGNYLKSVWSVLSTLAFAFPGAAYLLQLPQVHDSVLAPLYVAFAMMVTACLILVGVTIPAARDRDQATRAAVIALCIGCVSGILFVAAKASVQDSDVLVPPSSIQGDYQRVRGSRSGLVQHESGLSSFGSTLSTSSKKEYVDPLEVLALVLFVASCSSFAFAFTVLGFHHYLVSRDLADGPERSPPSG
jgi:hypothetical protein